MKKIKKIILRIKTYYALKGQLKTLRQTFLNAMERPINDRLKDAILLRLIDEMDEVRDKIDNV